MALTRLSNQSLTSISSLPAAISTGKVLQVQQATSNTFVSTSTQSYNTVVTVNITPASTSNSILLIGTISEPDGLAGRLAGRFFRGTQDLGDNISGQAYAGRFCSEFGRGLGYSGTEEHFHNVPNTMMDFPSTTSQVTYTIKVKPQNASNIRVGNGGAHNLICMEIAG
jgi:hypothetical protein